MDPDKELGILSSPHLRSTVTSKGQTVVPNGLIPLSLPAGVGWADRNTAPGLLTGSVSVKFDLTTSLILGRRRVILLGQREPVVY